VSRHPRLQPESYRRAVYDDLPEAAQAAARAEWDDRVAAALELDFTGELRAAGRPWAEGDGEDGTLVMRDPGPPAG
jgi:hypothetical protein